MPDFIINKTQENYIPIPTPHGTLEEIYDYDPPYNESYGYSERWIQDNNHYDSCNVCPSDDVFNYTDRLAKMWSGCNSTPGWAGSARWLACSYIDKSVCDKIGDVYPRNTTAASNTSTIWDSGVQFHSNIIHCHYNTDDFDTPDKVQDYIDYMYDIDPDYNPQNDSNYTDYMLVNIHDEDNDDYIIDEDAESELSTMAKIGILGGIILIIGIIIFALILT